jgi:hypothetical protein
MTRSNPHRLFLRRAAQARRLRRLGAVLLLMGASEAFAGSSGSTNLFTPAGDDRAAALGDFISATVGNGGIATFYRYFIEVPPGLTRLRVQVFDADILQGGAGESVAGRDYDDGAATVTTAIYTLVRPDTSIAATLTCDNNANLCAGSDNAWTSVLDSTTPDNTAAGHWELRVDMRTGSGDDINAIGIRADDGDEAAAGTELNVYIDSHTNIGVNLDATTNTRTYLFYPYVSSGCSFAENDFDYDVGEGTGNGPGSTFGQVNLTSRSGAVARQVTSVNLSGNNAWDRNALLRWGTDNVSSDYGLWTLNQRISNFVAGGNNSNNYANVYYTNDVAAPNPPAANPTPNTLRLYLASDGGVKPAKAYIEQFLACIPLSACGVLPAVGVARDYRVTLRLVSPTGPGSGTITFSNSKLVTVRVPGGAVRFRGQLSVTHGSIFSQPAFNAAGADDVEWNPGVIPAGTTALLTYVIRITPSAAGRTIVTGTPLSNGTRATWLDHTGNSSQARATFSTGGICELAISTTLITPAVVSGLTARRAPEGVEVEWSTASEVGTTGFDLLRFDRETRSFRKVNLHLLPGLITAPQGGFYRYLDRAAPGQGLARYKLVEHLADGKLREHGPYRVLIEASRLFGRVGRAEKGTAESPFDRKAWTPTRVELDALEGGASPRSKIGGSTAVKIGVGETGLYRVSAGTIAAQLGLSTAQAQALVTQRGLRLLNRTNEVPWFGSSDGILFYGRAADSPYSRENVYRLVRAGAAAVPETSGGNPLAPAPSGTFVESSHAEQDGFAATVVASNPDSDYWFWDFLIAGDAGLGTKSFALDLPGLAVGATRLTVNLYGATQGGVAGEHHAMVLVNGSDVGKLQWTGLAPQSAAFDLPAGVLQETGNSVEIAGLLDAGVAQSIFYVDGFDVSYPRRLRAAGDALAFGSGATSPLTVEGFSSPALTVLDVTQPDQPRRVVGALVTGTSNVSVTLVPSSPSAKYFVAGPQAIKSPAWVRPDLPSQLRLGRNGADYLVITSAALMAPASDLAAFRSEQGLVTAVVDIEDVVDEFNHGIPSPYALRDFLAFASLKWNASPRYVVLAGAGSYDYRDLLGLGGNLVPPLMAGIADGGLFASDYGFLPSPAAGGRGKPTSSTGLSIGRIPVTTAAALQAYVDKLRAYEEGPPAPWAAKALLVADLEGSNDFVPDAELMAGFLPSTYAPERIFLSQQPLAAARAQLLSEIASGVGLINYIGHGALDRLSAQGLLTNGDVAALTNGSRAPLLAAFTCIVNRFEVPGFTPFGSVLTAAPNGGAVAVFAPTGLNENAAGRALGETFYRELGLPDDGSRLGDVVQRAITTYLSKGGAADSVRVYTLLGDPALRLQKGASAAPQPTDPPGGPNG